MKLFLDSISLFRFAKIAVGTGVSLLAACGGGYTAPGASPVNDGSNAGTSTVAVVSGATVQLSNLPAEKTTTATAAIAYRLNAPSRSVTVSCRLDSYTPIVCPNPFVLGQQAGLKPGVHTVDYFVDTGSGVNIAQPDASYSWTVEVPRRHQPRPRHRRRVVHCPVCRTQCRRQ